MNLVRQLVLVCKTCRWEPPADMPIGDAELHFKIEHDTDGVSFELVPKCKCEVAAVMGKVVERPTGGGVKVYFECPECGRMGWVKQETTDG